MLTQGISSLLTVVTVFHGQKIQLKGSMNMRVAREFALFITNSTTSKAKDFDKV
jgi:hypothetical protein